MNQLNGPIGSIRHPDRTQPLVYLSELWVSIADFELRISNVEFRNSSSFKCRLDTRYLFLCFWILGALFLFSLELTESSHQITLTPQSETNSIMRVRCVRIDLQRIPQLDY